MFFFYICERKKYYLVFKFLSLVCIKVNNKFRLIIFLDLKGWEILNFVKILLIYSVIILK